MKQKPVKQLPRTYRMPQHVLDKLELIRMSLPAQPSATKTLHYVIESYQIPKETANIR